ncbi:MAG: lysylphosphatidylglycerol synthase domain-containing protein [Rhizomicrobium sp.]|nr:lysylphosphatidylglycerol synthase domain-containing protein [Rhizomicrobium sp.]
MTRALIFTIGCGLLIALAWFAGATAIAKALTDLGIVGLIIAGLIHLPTVALMAVAFRSAGGSTAPFTDYLAARVVRDAAADLLPFSQFGGFAAGLRVLQLRGGTVMANALTIFLDLTMEFAAKAPHTATGLLLLISLVPGSPLVTPLALLLAALVLASALAVAFRGRLRVACAAAARRILARWAKQQDSRGVIAEGFAASRLLPCFVLHVLCWFLGSLETYVVFALLHHPVTLAEAVVIDSLANTLKTFAVFIPAAAGVQEGAYVLICAALGIGAAPAMAFSLARRARELLIGLPALGLWNVLETRRRSA